MNRLLNRYSAIADHLSALRFELANPPLEITWMPDWSFRLRRHNPVFWFVHLFVERDW